MKFADRIQKVDRRIIYGILALAVILPLVFRLGLKTYTTTPVEDLYRHIDAAAGKDDMAIIMDFTHDPGVLPELYPMDLAILRHCFQRNIKVFTISFLPQGAAIIQLALSEVKEDYPNIEANVDYCNFGFKPWSLKLPIMLGMGDDIAEAVETNSEGLKLENLPIMQNMKNYDNIQVVVEISGSSMGQFWVTYARAKFGVDVAVGLTAVMAADVYPFLQTGQFVGSLGGLKGAAEYEQLVDIFAMNNTEFSKKNARNMAWVEAQYKELPELAKLYKYNKARIGMDAQAIVHVLIILFIILGNIGYFLDQRAQKKKFVK
ncbi:MAG TPA: hypothetical protein ENL10_05105 [Candidatus Cloacimonetes bacterium]|nr:hypothetical protein [Candidatus Cloacimonadota bacterium]HHE40860.1 hypothetical protein [Candidatus Cloacimonadota bacterium]